MIMLTTPLNKEAAKNLKAGDQVLLSGVIYTARDAAHKRLCQQIAAGNPLPLALQDQILYFVGPAPAKEGAPIGSAGPTTSGRMDAYSPTLLRLGLRGMIGKGARNKAVIDSMKETGAVYFGAVGGCGAYLAGCVKKAEVIAYPDLGPEAIHRLEVENMPLTVVIDSLGNNLYETGPRSYLESI